MYDNSHKKQKKMTPPALGWKRISAWKAKEGAYYKTARGRVVQVVEKVYTSRSSKYATSTPQMEEVVVRIRDDEKGIDTKKGIPPNYTLFVYPDLPPAEDIADFSEPEKEKSVIDKMEAIMADIMKED